MTPPAATALAGAHDAGAREIASVERWTERTVAWYERANAGSNYADQVLRAAREPLAGAGSVLDVGAGFGALALPLARRGIRVTALEPAPAMADALRRAVRAAGLSNVEVIEAAWGAVSVAPHDVVLCAHVGPLLAPGSSFPAAVTRVASRAVVLVRDAPGSDDKFFFADLYPRLLGRLYERRCAGRDPLAALASLAVQVHVVPIEYRSDQPFDSLEEACDFWTAWMDLDDAARPSLRAFLGRRLERRGEGWVAPYRKRANVVWWWSGSRVAAA